MTHHMTLTGRILCGTQFAGMDYVQNGWIDVTCPICLDFGFWNAVERMKHILDVECAGRGLMWGTPQKSEYTRLEHDLVEILKQTLEVEKG